jgi:hypothetical protein
MKTFYIFLFLFMWVSRLSLAADTNKPALSSLWPIIRRDMDAFTNNSSSNSQQLDKIRRVIDEFSIEQLNVVPSNQMIHSLGRLTAALFLLGERGNTSDEARLLKFVELRIPTSAVEYGCVPHLPEVPIVRITSSSGEVARQKFPACYSLAKISRRNPSDNNGLLTLATNENVSMESALRILAVMIDSQNQGAVAYSDYLQKKYALEKDPSKINDILVGKKTYWSNTF